MGWHRIVVADEALAHAALLHSYRLHPERQRELKTRAPRPTGTEHAAPMSDACPEGRPNCRNCGDPAFADACKAAGHCPQCGVTHGIAPDAVLAANGYALVEVPQ